MHQMRGAKKDFSIVNHPQPQPALSILQNEANVMKFSHLFRVFAVNFLHSFSLFSFFNQQEEERARDSEPEDEWRVTKQSN